MRAAPRLAAAVVAACTVANATASPAVDYTLFCQGCHGAEARGVPGKVPALAATLALFMGTRAGRDYLLRVPGAANSALTDAQLAAVLNWLAGRYPAADVAAPAPFTVAEVARVRRTPLSDVLGTRREVLRDLAARGAAPAPDY